MVWGCNQAFQNPKPKAKLTKDWEGSHHSQRHLDIPIPVIASNLPLELLFQNTTDSGVWSFHLYLSQDNFKFHFEFHYWLIDCAGTWCLISRCLWCFWASSKKWFLLLWHQGLEWCFDLLESGKTCLWPHHAWLGNLFCYCYLCVCEYVHAGTCRGQKRAPDPLQLELRRLWTAYGVC